jgi:hypothetical protein
MPHADPEERRVYYMQNYIQCHPDRVDYYHRNLVLTRAMDMGRLPSKHSIRRYNINEDELRPIMDKVLSMSKANVAVSAPKQAHASCQHAICT